MKLGFATYLVPFMFVLEPALILAEGGLAASIAGLRVLVGLSIVAAGLQGWLPRFGHVSMLVRTCLFVGGFAIALPELSVLSIEVSQALVAGLGLILVMVALASARFGATGRSAR